MRESNATLAQAAWRMKPTAADTWLLYGISFGALAVLERYLGKGDFLLDADATQQFTFLLLVLEAEAS